MTTNIGDRPHQDLYRVWHASPFDDDPITPRLRAEETDDGVEGPILFGHFARWNEWNEISSPFEGHFMERLDSGSMTESFERMVPKAIFDHGHDPYVGMKPLGVPTRVEADDFGPAYEVPLFDSVPALVVDGLRAGAYGASYRFSVDEERIEQEPEVSEHNPAGIPEVTLLRVNVKEFGPTAFGADPMATASVRSVTDRFVGADLSSVQQGTGVVADKEQGPRPGASDRAATLRRIDLERLHNVHDRRRHV